ncbi:hypothetical protein OF83DRAFT_1228775 [Amylostereum chailletii]|nr:hypothetical protein OF83DRAFT_1228775 [Amylostereum chailletii]
MCCQRLCDQPVKQGCKTCVNPEYQALEAVAKEGKSAMFQLRHRAQRHGIPLPPDALETSSSGIGPNGEDGLDIDQDGLCEGKSPDGNTKLRAHFSRERTHNEQLCVATCGVILGRATFYGSEAPNGARLFLRYLFPTPYSLPHILFYNNACKLLKRIREAQEEAYFSHCKMPVDVFHMRTKHKDSDAFCGEHCNPITIPGLVKDGKWRFNSSAAEMTNAWFGGFQSNVREMRPERFDFFLDEMIKQRNRMIVLDLQKRSLRPYSIPRSDLIGH